MTPVFLDANVFIYTIGRPHRLKAPCASVIEKVSLYPDSFFTDAEVFQEVLHRYLAIKMWPAVRDRFADFLTLMTGRIVPMIRDDVELAGQLADHHTGLAARDLVHLAVMRRTRVTRIVSADTGFDGIDGIERLDPMLVGDWAHIVTGAS